MIVIFVNMHKKITKYIIRFLIFLIIAILPSGHTMTKLDYRKGRYLNVCKDLRGDMLIYFIFVDSKETKPWSDYDIRSTIDSIRVAVDWLYQQANENIIYLKIKTDYYIGEEYSTIKKSLPMGTVEKSFTEPNITEGIEELNKWADNIAKKAGSSFNIVQKDGIPEVKNPRDKERLVAYLRDENNVESVALLFMVNNYFKTDISIPVNILNSDDVEYAIVSFKYPSEIAHNVLHLYGAADLYKTPYRRHEKKIALAEKEFPNEIMLEPYAKNIWKLKLSVYTKYLIGWHDELPKQYELLLTDRSINF